MQMALEPLVDGFEAPAHPLAGCLASHRIPSFAGLPPVVPKPPTHPKARTSHADAIAASPASGDNRRVKRSIVQPSRVTVHYLNFVPLKRTAPPPWLGAFYGR